MKYRENYRKLVGQWRPGITGENCLDCGEQNNLGKPDWPLDTRVKLEKTGWTVETRGNWRKLVGHWRPEKTRDN